MDDLKGFDTAKYNALLNAPLPNPLPKDAILVIGADWCPDTKKTLHQSNYPAQTQDGRPILYFNDAKPETHTQLASLPGHEILGGGVDSKRPPSRPTREYNYPTVVTVKDGKLTEVIFGDTVPPGYLTQPDKMEARWEAGAPERARRAQYPRYDADKAERRFNDNPPKEVKPDTVYAIVSSNCGHCHELLARTDYPKKTDDGHRIVYLNIAVGEDGKTPVDPKDYAFYKEHLGKVGIDGYPTFVTSDANGKLSIAAGGPDPIIEKFFPKTLAAETARGIKPAAPAVSETPAETAFVPPPPPPAEPAKPATPPRDVSHEVYMSIRALSEPNEKNLMGRMTDKTAAGIIEKHIYANGGTVSNSDRDTKQGDGKLSTNEMGAFAGILRADDDRSKALVADLRAAGFLKDVPETTAATKVEPAGTVGASATTIAEGAKAALTATDVQPGETPDGNKGVIDARSKAPRDASAGMKA